MSSEIVRIVRNIRRTRTASEAINASRRMTYIHPSVLVTMPVGEGPEEVELIYFKPEPNEYDLPNGCLRNISNLGVLAALNRRNLRPDPQAQVADNESDPSFADKHPNGCIWNLEGNMASSVVFSQWGDVGRSVDVERRDHWPNYMWFAGVRNLPAS